MATYTKLNADDVHLICKHYALEINNFRSIDGGSANSSFLLNGREQQYVLTVFDDSSWANVLNLGQLLQLLEKYAFPTTRLLTTTKNETAVSHQNKPIIIKKYITGTVCSNLPSEIIYQIGQVMAKLHQIPPPSFLPKHHFYGRKLFPIAFNRNIDPTYESWLAQKTDYFNEQFPKNLPTGLTHGDLFYDNVLAENNQFKAILDFEGACLYPLVFDIGMAIVGLCHENSIIHLDKASAFVAGYQSIRPLELEEKTAVQFMAEYGATATSYWRFWKYNIDAPMPEKANKHWQMVNLAKFIELIPFVDFFNTIFSD